MLDDVLVVLCGEFSRTPRMNDGSGRGKPGRDHWGDSMFCLMGGGGVKGGRIVGSTDSNGTRPTTRAVTPSNIHATIYRCLGIDPQITLRDLTGRPVNVLDDPTPIDELFRHTSGAMATALRGHDEASRFCDRLQIMVVMATQSRGHGTQSQIEHGDENRPCRETTPGTAHRTESGATTLTG